MQVNWLKNINFVGLVQNYIFFEICKFLGDKLANLENL